MKAKAILVLQLAVVVLVCQALVHDGIVLTGVARAHTLELPLAGASPATQECGTPSSRNDPSMSSCDACRVETDARGTVANLHGQIDAALASGPVLLFFHSPRCGYCRGCLTRTSAP